MAHCLFSSTVGGVLIRSVKANRVMNTVPPISSMYSKVPWPFCIERLVAVLLLFVFDFLTFSRCGSGRGF